MSKHTHFKQYHITFFGKRSDAALNYHFQQGYNDFRYIYQISKLFRNKKKRVYKKCFKIHLIYDTNKRWIQIIILTDVIAKDTLQYICYCYKFVWQGCDCQLCLVCSVDRAHGTRKVLSSISGFEDFSLSLGIFKSYVFFNSQFHWRKNK